MRRTDTTRRPAERFSILMVSRNRSRIRRLECSRRTLQAAIAAFAAFVVLVVSATVALIAYRHDYNATESVRVQAADFMREKAALLGRLAELEESVARTERFAAKIETAVDKKQEGLAGRGPVDEEDWLPAEDKGGTSTQSLQLGNVWRSPFAKSLTAGLNLSLDQLDKRNAEAEKRVHSVFALQQDKLFFWASLPSIWPAHGWVTSEFGAHRGWAGGGRLHEGIDIAGPSGTPIVAPGDGLVTFSGYYHGYGQMITIDHGYGISTLYGHCSAMYVAEGQRVKRGSIIAAVGNTGSSTGPHLHYEVHVDGIPVNPMLYVMK